MKAIGGLLRNGRFGEHAEFSAAFVIGAVNSAIGSILQLPPSTARATSYKHGAVTIAVAHGAIGGQIQQVAGEILIEANKKILASGNNQETIKKIFTRPLSQPSP